MPSPHDGHPIDALLNTAAERARRYAAEIGDRAVMPTPAAIAGLAGFHHPLPDKPTDGQRVIALLDELGAPATVASTGGRYFGFVLGGALPAAIAAMWLAAVWDQSAGMVVTSPVAAELEAVALDWAIDLLGLPAGTGGGLTTGATMANFSALAAARHALLQRAGWDVEARGLFEAPPINVVVGDEVHVSVLKALSMLGLGRDRVTRVPVDGQGRMRADALPRLDGMTIVCTQAGNVNTGAFDPIAEVCDRARPAGAWVHVDGAFGLWAAASPALAHLALGMQHADSWATDAHKWLNVPQDCGLALCRRPEHLHAAMSATAAYLVHDARREPHQLTPEMTRRARGVELWAALLSLGRKGLAQLVEDSCHQARRFAEGLASAGFRVLNDVVLNQVLVSFGDAENTRRVITAIQHDGTCWCGGTQWQGQTAMRISVCSWATTDDDVDRSLEAMLAAAKAG